MLTRVGTLQVTQPLPCDNPVLTALSSDHLGSLQLHETEVML